jgi:hypothetical protein
VTKLADRVNRTPDFDPHLAAGFTGARRATAGQSATSPAFPGTKENPASSEVLTGKRGIRLANWNQSWRGLLWLSTIISGRRDYVQVSNRNISAIIAGLCPKHQCYQ